MIKKYFGITLIAASLAVAGCSSDDDDGGGILGELTPDAPDAPDVPDVDAPSLPAADASNDSSAFDVIANSADHTQLLMYINVAGLADTLDNPEADFTIFAPNDAVFEAIEAANPGAIAAMSVEDLTLVLQRHVVSGTVTSTEISEGVTSTTEDAPFMLNSLVATAPLTFINSEAGLMVNNALILTPDLAPQAEGATGIVHSINAVLAAPPADATPPDETPVDPGAPPVDGGEIGPSLTGLNAAGFTDYVTVFNNTALGLALDDNAWTVFVPANGVLPASDLALDADASFGIVNNNLITSGAFSAAELLAGAGGVTANSGAALTFGGTADALTVNGFNATPVSVAGSAATIFAIDGVITP